MTRPLLRLALALVTVACGDESSGPGYAGDYQITSIMENPDACGDLLAGTIEPDQEFFQLADDDFLGVSLIGWHRCSAQGTCEDSISLADSFFEEEGEWVARSSFISGDPMPCEPLSHRTTIERLDATTIQTHLISRQGPIAAFPDGCPRDEDDLVDWDLIEPYYDELPCVTERITTAISTSP